MQIFKDTYLTWWQVGMFKWGVFGCGLLIGAYLHEEVWAFALPIFIVTLACIGYISVVWYREHR